MSKAINSLEPNLEPNLEPKRVYPARGGRLVSLPVVYRFFSVLGALWIALVLGVPGKSFASGCGSATLVTSSKTGPCTNSATTTFEVTGSGSISGGAQGVRNDSGGSITTFTNAGSIDGSSYGVLNNSGASIVVLTNTGTITGGTGINNAGAITTINNRQGASTSALTYTGILPVNYNIIVASTTNYGQLSASSVTNAAGTSGLTFGVDSSSVLMSNRYLGVLSGLTLANINSGSVSGSYGDCASCVRRQTLG
jgi:hypothetical protein